MPSSLKTTRRKATVRKPTNRTLKPTRATAAVSRQADTRAPRAGSKLSKVIELLSRMEGANVAELTSTTKWLPHTARAALTGLRKRGYQIERFRGEGESSHYRIAATKSVSAKG
jgi:Protein of unknown function (DUF3489)